MMNETLYREKYLLIDLNKTNKYTFLIRVAANLVKNVSL